MPLMLKRCWVTGKGRYYHLTLACPGIRRGRYDRPSAGESRVAISTAIKMGYTRKCARCW